MWCSAIARLLLAINLIVAAVNASPPAAFGISNNTITFFSHSTIESRSHLLPAAERIFSRKRRFLLLPKGGSLKATIQLTKRLLAVVPRGMNFAVEAAFYYPCPTARIDLIPKRLRKPTTTTPKPPPQPPLYVYIPGTEIRYKAKPAAKPQKVQRIDDLASGGGPLQWVDTPHASHKPAKWPTKWQPAKWQQYADPQRWSKWSHLGEAYQQKYAPWSTNQGEEKNKHSKQQQWQSGGATSTAKWAKWTTPAPSWEKWQQPQTRWMRSIGERVGEGYEEGEEDQDEENEEDEEKEEESAFLKQPIEEPFYAASPYEDFETAEYRPMYFPDLEPFDESRHYHGHRDRRQLFHQFGALGKLFGIDMESCVLRAVCESKRLLLPRGYSMLHDILRLVLTFPTINGLDDEYSRLMRMEYAVCHKRLRKKCTLSLLGWLLQPPQRKMPSQKSEKKK